LKKVESFWGPKNVVPNDHVYHATHHNLTTISPSKNTLFPSNPLQKRPQNRKKRPPNRPTFFIQELPPNPELIEWDLKPIKQEVVRETPRAKVSAHAAGTNPGSR
jgi:hypothetical protein